jgi:acyltransferase
VHLRGLTAPLFLLVSGAASVLGLRYEQDGRVSRVLLRRRVLMALVVIAIGYLLVFPASRIADLWWISPKVWRGFLQVNILQLNGVTLLLLTTLLAFTRTVRRYAAWSLGLGFLILLLAPVVFSVEWFRWLPEGLAAYLSFSHGSLFPLFPASAYMFLGVGLGALLLELPEARRVRGFRLACLAASAALLLLSLAAEHIPASLLPAHDAYKAGHAYTLLRLGFALLIFGTLAWVAERWPRLATACAPMGRKSLYVYVGHLVLIYGTPWTPGLVSGHFQTLSLGDGAQFIPLVAGLTFGTILAWDWIRNRSEAMGTLVHASAVFALAYALVF